MAFEYVHDTQSKGAMETLSKQNQEKPPMNKYLFIAFGIAAVVVACALGVWLLQPSNEQIDEDLLAGAFREGSPEFAEHTKGLVIQTDENSTTQSPTAFGTIVMFLGANIKNYTGKNIVGLEVRASVVDQLGKPIREKTLIVVPKQEKQLAPDSKIYVNVRMDGFNKDEDRADIRWKVTAIKFD